MSCPYSQDMAPKPPSRPLTEADRRIWQRVARTVTPKTPAKPDAKLRAPKRGEFADMMRVAPPERAEPKRPGPLEATQAKAVRRGRVRIDAKVDLHDLTLAEAYPELERALIRSANRNHACVLVITGKGPRLEGKIRGALPGWLAGSALRPLVATYASAHIKHGGSGAWYVFLKQAD